MAATVGRARTVTVATRSPIAAVEVDDDVAETVPTPIAAAVTETTTYAASVTTTLVAAVTATHAAAVALAVGGVVDVDQESWGLVVKVAHGPPPVPAS
jgi:hypothetical protein